MSETGSSEDGLKEESIQKHFNTATNSSINQEVRNASGEALHHLSKDVGENRYIEMLRKLMFKK